MVECAAAFQLQLEVERVGLRLWQVAYTAWHKQILSLSLFRILAEFFGFTRVLWVLVQMSSAAAKAEARRKAILSRGSDRLSKLTSSARGEDNPVYMNNGKFYELPPIGRSSDCDIT